MADLITPNTRRCFPLFAQLVEAQQHGATLAQHGAALDALLAAAENVAPGVGPTLLLALQAAFHAGAEWSERARYPVFEDEAVLRDAAMRLDDLRFAHAHSLADAAAATTRRAAA